jgi:hypothetical protein
VDWFAGIVFLNPFSFPRGHRPNTVGIAYLRPPPGRVELVFF